MKKFQLLKRELFISIIFSISYFYFFGVSLLFFSCIFLVLLSLFIFNINKVNYLIFFLPILFGSIFFLFDMQNSYISTPKVMYNNSFNSYKYKYYHIGSLFIPNEAKKCNEKNTLILYSDISWKNKINYRMIYNLSCTGGIVENNPLTKKDLIFKYYLGCIFMMLHYLSILFMNLKFPHPTME